MGATRRSSYPRVEATQSDKSVCEGVGDGGGHTPEGSHDPHAGGRTPHVIGFAFFWLGLFGLAAMFASSGRRRLAALAGVLFLGVTLVPCGGGLLILAAFAAVALVPQRLIE